MTPPPHWRPLVLLAAAVGVGGTARPTFADEAASFRRDVAPILVTHCVRCHQPGNRKGGLSLTTSAGLIHVPADAVSFG